MKIILFISMIIFLQNCSKPETVLICGDHVCVNKAEAKQYFEENLTLEVKIIDKKDYKNLNLVELNLNPSVKGNKIVSISNKIDTNKKIKTLSNDEIKRIKSQIKNKKNKNISMIKKENKTSIIKKNDKPLLSKKTKKNLITEEKKQNSDNYIKKVKRNADKKTIKVVDVCTILEKCSIEEISKYLLKEGKNKKFPDITTRE